MVDTHGIDELKMCMWTWIDTNAYAAKANDMKASSRLGWKVDTSKQTDRCYIAAAKGALPQNSSRTKYGDVQAADNLKCRSTTYPGESPIEQEYEEILPI